jgi:hypothetical protein
VGVGEHTGVGEYTGSMISLVARFCSQTGTRPRLPFLVEIHLRNVKRGRSRTAWDIIA